MDGIEAEILSIHEWQVLRGKIFRITELIKRTSDANSNIE